MNGHRFAIAVVSSWVLGACAAPVGEDASLVDVPGAQSETLEGNTTLKFVPPGAVDTSAAQLGAAVSRTVSVFYPKPGQSQDGLCWEGLTSDRAGNLYPIANAGFSKLDRRANLVNG